jgi:hypothetical protein
MAGTTDNYTVTAIPAGVVAKLYSGMAVPTAGNRATLDATTLTPDATAHPSAKHLGYTDAGITVTMTTAATEFFADEAIAPIARGIDSGTLTISGTLLQVNDEEVMKVLLADIGTYSTAAGYKQFTLGLKTALSYASFAVIYPSPADATKAAVLQLYSAANTAGVTFQLGRKTRAGTPFTITGYAVAGRASADNLGNFWWQI